MQLDPEVLAGVMSAWDAVANDATPHIRVVAGPGTGKSSAIARRVSRLLRDGQAPETIAAVSFTRAAALDLERRVKNFALAKDQAEAASVRVSTLHSLALRALAAGNHLGTYPARPSVLDDWELQHIFDPEFAAAAGLTPNRASGVREQFEALVRTGELNSFVGRAARGAGVVLPPTHVDPNP